MAARTLPGTGLTAYFDFGESGWNDEVDENFRLTSALTGGSVLSNSSPIPGSGSLGDIQIVAHNAVSNPNKLAIWDGAPGSEAWTYYDPVIGWSFYVIDSDEIVLWDGTDWIQPSPPVTLNGIDGIPGTDDFAGEALKVLRVNAGETAYELTDDFVAEAPTNSINYVRYNGGWVALPDDIGDAASDGTVYGRQDGTWHRIDEFPEAPLNGDQYARQNGGWSVISIPSGAITDAPSDGTTYGRRDGVWVDAGGGGGGVSVLTFEGALLNHSGDQQYLLGASRQIIEFDGAEYDTNSYFSSGTPDRFTIPTGVARVKLTAQITATGHGDNTSFRMLMNGAQGVGLPEATLDTGETSVTLVSAILDVTLNDYFELDLQTNADLDIIAAGTFFQLEVVTVPGATARVADLTDVDLDNRADGDVLAWNASTAMWEVGTPVTTANETQGLNRPFKGALIGFAAAKTVSNPATVVWDEVEYDTDSFWNVGTPTRITIPTGVEKVNVMAGLIPNGSTFGTGDDYITIYKNGSAAYRGRPEVSREVGSASRGISVVSPPLAVTVNDYFEVYYGNSGAGSPSVGTESYFAVEVLETNGAI